MKGIEINGVKINLNDLDLSEIKAVLGLLDRANLIEKKEIKQEQKTEKKTTSVKRKYVKKTSREYKPVSEKFDEILKHIKAGKKYSVAVFDVLGRYFSIQGRKDFSEYLAKNGYVLIEHLDSFNSKLNKYEVKKRDELKANDLLETL